MKRIALASILAALACVVPVGVAGAAEFENYDIESASTSLSSTQAGDHADFTTDLALTEKEGSPYAKTSDVVVRLPAGIIGNPEAFPKCTTDQLGTKPDLSECPIESQVGSTDLTVIGAATGTFENEPIYNMPAPGGDIVARFGFFAAIYPVILNVRLDPETRSLVASVEGAASAVELVRASTTFWGVPADKVHDPERLTPNEVLLSGGPVGGRPSTMPEIPFMTNPTSCKENRQVTITVVSYQEPSRPRTVTVPFPQITGCGALEFEPTVSVRPTTAQGTAGSGLDYELSLPNKGLEYDNVYGGSHLERTEVVLPEGMTVNPSQAEGLGVCSQADLARETYNSAPNVGCPETSKIGSVEAITPVIDRNPTGSLYIAKPYDNPFGSLIALYMVLKIPDRGVLLKVAGEVTLDSDTGQITTVFEDLPELPFETFRLHFREGSRAPLVTPTPCGHYDAVSNFVPWSAPGKTVTRLSSFSVDSGPDRGPCPSGGLPPFKPGLLSYSVNPIAGAFSPFYVRLSRTDAEQEMTHFSVKLPPGLSGKLAGIPFCPEDAIAAAKARTGIHGGEEELNAPSCPAASQIGSLYAGAGVGTTLAYVTGKVYLAGPYNGSPLSILAVTAAKAGPFDLGTVVVREALRINPETAEVFVDATGSDPIPHIIAGVPVRLRDIRIFMDRPRFTINPTSCKPTAVTSTIRGAGLDFTSEADNNPITVATPYQVADCASLKYKPRLQLRLKGSTKRGGNPALTAILRPRPGDANSSRISVALPHSEFLEQGHIRTICTRVQFKAAGGNGEACPAASVYGKAKAWTPLLDEPLTGNIYLRSSENPLPDMVLAMHGLVDFHAVGRIDSVNGGIRNTFDFVPDAPITKVVVSLGGGKKSLLANSTNICRGSHKATVQFAAHNGRARKARVPLKAQCGKKGKKKSKRQSTAKGTR